METLLNFERGLGVIISSNFKWDEQHDKIVKKTIKC